MYPLLRMKDLSGIVVILLFFSATRCYIQESYTRSNSCSRDDEIYKNNSNIVFGKSCPLEYDVPSKIKERTSKLNQQVISDREILHGEARTLNTKGYPSSKSSFYGSVQRSDVRTNIRSTRDDRIFMSRERNHQNHRETKISTERRILSRTQRDLTSEDSIRISTSRSFQDRIVIPRAIAGRNERRSARFFSRSNSDIRSRSVIALRSQSFESYTQPSPSIGKHMVKEEHQERLHLFGNRRQHDNHEATETWKQVNITPENTMEVSSININFSNRKITPRTSRLRRVGIENEVSDTRNFPNTYNFQIRSRSVSNSRRQVLERDTEPARFLEIRLAMDTRATSRFIPSRNTFYSRNLNSISTLKQGIERDMQQARRLERRMVKDQREGRLHRFGNDRRQRENHREFEKNNKILTIRDSPTQTKRETDVTRKDPMGISTSTNFASRGRNPNTLSLHTIRTGNERTTSRLIPNRNTLNSRKQNLISSLRQGIERDIQQARRLEKRIAMDQREGRLHRFGNDRRQRESHRVFQRNNKILTIRNSPTQTKRESEFTREDPMGISTPRNVDTRENNPNDPTLHTIRIGNEHTSSRLISSRNTWIGRSQNLIPMLRHGVERDMRQARRLEERMVMDRREGRLHRSYRKQRENDRVFERNENLENMRDFTTQTSSFATRKTSTSRNRNSIFSLRQGVERDMQQARRQEKRMVMDQREAISQRFGNDRRQHENDMLYERSYNRQTTRNSETQTEREADITLRGSVGTSTSRSFTTRSNNHRISGLRTIRIGNEHTTSRFISSRNTLNNRNHRQGVERDMQQDRRQEKRMLMDQREGRIYQIDNDRRQLENNRKFRGHDNLLYIREESSDPSLEKSPQRDERNRKNIPVAASRSSDVRLNRQSANSNTHFFRDFVRSNLNGHRAATLAITNSGQRINGPTAKNIRFNSYRVITSRFSESKDYHENLLEIRQINRLQSRETYESRRASLVDGRSTSFIDQPIHSRRISHRIHEQNRDNYRSSRNEINVLSDATDKIDDTQKFRMKIEINKELVPSRYSMVRSSLNVESTDSKDPVWSKNLSRERGRNTILSDNHQRNLFEDYYSSDYLKEQQVRLNDQQLFTRDSKKNRQLSLADGIREIERNFGQRKTPKFSRDAENSEYNVQHISRSSGNINKNEQSSTGPWFGVIQISFAAIVLGQLIFSDEKNSNRMFSTNVLKKLKSS